MSFLNKSAAAFALTAAAAATSAAFAAGFQLTEQSSLGLGRAYAGAGIVGDDLSAVHYNPAGMTLLPGTRFQAGGVWIDVDAPIKTGNGDSENGRLKGQVIPAGYTTHQVNDSLWLGFAMTVPYGMGIEYAREWKYGNRGTDAKIYTFDMNPSIAWKVSDQLSLGAGLSVQYAKANMGMNMGAGDLSLAHARVEADSWDWGYNFGIMFSPVETVRLGLAYRSAIEHDADGDVTLKLSDSALGILTKPDRPMAEMLGSMPLMVGTSTTLKTPDTLMLTGTWEATDKLRLSGLVRWANWSNFEKLTLNNEISSTLANGLGQTVGGAIGANPSIGQAIGQAIGNKVSSELKNTTIENYWKDTWLVSVGADYRINDAFIVRGGVAYETSPIDDQSTRMAIIPDTDRLWLSLGGTYHFSKQLQFDMGATYLMGVGDMDIYDKVGGKKVGEFDAIDAYLFGVQMQYRF